MPKHQQLRLIQSTENIFSAFEATGLGKDADGEANQTVIAAYLHHKPGKLVARAVNWPEPLKWAHMPKPGAITINIDRDGPRLESGACTIKLASDVCIKGLHLEFREGDGVVFEDDCVDLVPGARSTLEKGIATFYSIAISNVIVMSMDEDDHTMADLWTRISYMLGSERSIP